MPIDIDRAPREATEDDKVVQRDLPDHLASYEPAGRFANQMETQKSVWEQFVHNLMVALGPWTV
jgi:hypothetical protein